MKKHIESDEKRTKSDEKHIKTNEKKENHVKNV